MSTSRIQVECYGRTYSLLLVPVTDTDYANLYGRDITEIRQAEESLRKSERNFRRSIDDSPLGIRIVDDDGETLYANRALLDIYGYENIDELKNTPVKERYTPESYAEYKLRKQKRQRNEYLPLEYEVSIVRKNGETRHLKVFRKEVLWNGKRHFQSVYEDVTERKRDEERIRNLNKVLNALRGINQLITREKGRERLIQKSCELMVGTRGFLFAWILLFDEHRKYITAAVNGEEMQLFGKQLEQGNYPPCIDRILAHKDSLAICSDIVENGLDCLPRSYRGDGQGLISRLEYEGKVYGVVSVYVPRDFALDPEEQSLFRELAGDIAYALSRIEVEEEQQKADEALRQSEEKYRSLFQNMMNGYAFCKMLFDSENNPVDFVYLDVNDSFERLTGLKKEVVLGKRVTEAIPGIKELNPELIPTYGEVVLTGRPVAFEVFFKPLDIWLTISVYRPQKDHFVAIFDNITERKQSEEALRKSEEKYRTIFELSIDAIYITAMDGKIIDMNQSLLDLYGYTREEMMAINARKLYVNPADRDKFWRDMEQKGSLENYELKLRKKDGTVIDCLVSATMRFGDDGVPIHQGMIHDVTERKQAEELIRTLEQSSPIGIYIVQDGKFQYVNRPFTKTMGYTTEQLLGKNPLDFVHPEDREMVRSNAILMMKGKLSYSYEYRVFSHSGEIKWIVENVASIQYQGRQATLGNFINITERKQAEETLRSSEERLRIIFESVPEGVVFSDLQNNILHVNEATVRIHGLDDRKQIIGRNISEFISEKDHDNTKKRRERAREFGPVKDAAITLKRKDGSEFPAEVSVSAVGDASGKPIGFVSVIKDITEHRRMEEQLMRADRLASIGELASGIAHELNNPLTSVIGFSDLLLEKDVPEDIKEDLKVINREAHRTAGVVKNLLTFARKHPEEKQLVDIHSVIQGTLELRKYEHKISNIQVITRLSPDLPEVMANDFQLRQVFLNIIVNAEFFMIEAHGKGTLTITTEQVDNSIRVSFADDGPGIAPENLRKIFDPFFTTKEVGKGTGLGLSICHGIIVAHDGRIYAESQPGKGATFIVELPVSR